MRIVIVSNLDNGIGLQRDFELLRDFLVSRGHEVYGQHYTQPAAEGTYDLGIFLETIAENLVTMATRWLYVANPEWLKPEFVRPIQRHCEKVIAKTRAAEKALRGTFSSVHYTGFLTADKGDPKIKRERKFLHIGGNSGMRGTNAVIETWREYRYWDDVELPELTVISNSKETAEFEDTPGVKFIKRATDEQVKELQNSCLYHLMPSAYEGFGHALHESQSVGAILLTTDAEPMTDLKAPFEVKPFRERKVNFGMLHDVAPLAIRETVPKMLALPNYEIARMRTEARLRFEQGNKEFAERFDALLASSERTAITVPASDTIAETSYARLSPPVRSLRISMIGNFHPPHSTENDLLWTLRDMGHTVVTFQENEDTTEEILRGSKGSQLCLFIHTHGWTTPGLCTLDCLWEKLKEQGTITASFHLDKYWGLNESDRREDLIGKHPFWRTDAIFTADGGNQKRFEDRGVRHYWLPPGVIRRECHFGNERSDLACDIGFVGATGYHTEYKFRGELLGFLQSVYGARFRIFQGYRGQALNDLYASIRVVVGDSCFGGSDYYWSDRVSETTGRGGFLIHPACRGLQIPGLVTFTAGDLQELQDKIDYALAHDSFRKWSRSIAQQWVADNETYSNRMTSLLRTVGLQ